MKKFLVSILAILYLNSAIGAIVFLQYCVDDFSPTDFSHHSSKIYNQNENQLISNPGKDCCQQENKNFNFQNYHLAAVSVHSVQQPITVLFTTSNSRISFADLLLYTKLNLIRYLTLNSNSVAVYIRNCVFLI